MCALNLSVQHTASQPYQPACRCACQRKHTPYNLSACTHLCAHIIPSTPPDSPATRDHALPGGASLLHSVSCGRKDPQVVVAATHQQAVGQGRPGHTEHPLLGHIRPRLDDSPVLQRGPDGQHKVGGTAHAAGQEMTDSPSQQAVAWQGPGRVQEACTQSPRMHAVSPQPGCLRLPV